MFSMHPTYWEKEKQIERKFRAVGINWANVSLETGVTKKVVDLAYTKYFIEICMLYYIRMFYNPI